MVVNSASLVGVEQVKSFLDLLLLFFSQFSALATFCFGWEHLLAKLLLAGEVRSFVVHYQEFILMITSLNFKVEK
jgi:hypothetical protein